MFFFLSYSCAEVSLFIEEGRESEGSPYLVFYLSVGFPMLVIVYIQLLTATVQQEKI